ncbi:MAG: peptidylprolyl isomerase [Cyclobacteriaceae bacterium]
MKKHWRQINLKYFAISLFVITSLVGNAQQDIDKIIAKVDNYIILKSDLEKAYLDFLSRGEVNSGNLKCRVLENLVVNKMMVAKAEIDSVFVDDVEVQSNLSQRMNYMVSQLGSEEEIEKFYGKTLEQIQSELFDEVKEQMTIQRMQSEITADLKVTPTEVKRFFSNIPRDSLPYFSTEVEVGQIVFKPKPGKVQLERAEKLLLDIRSDIISGRKTFADQARLFSEDPGSGSNGGQLPFYRRGELAPEFEAAAMTMEAGQMSMPVKTDFGYHLIELQEKRGNTFKSRHILVIPKPSLDDIDQTEKNLDSLRTVIINDSITFRAAAKEHSDDLFTSQNGGFFTDQEGNSRVSVETLDPNIFFTVDTMKIGSITRPLKYTAEDGTTAFRILLYQSKTPPHQANLKDDYQKIASAALNEKKNKLLGNWFEEAREDVFIQLDSEYNYCNIMQ